jgi:hypothetical protein
MYDESSETSHFMSLDDHVLHMAPELYETEIPGPTWYDTRVMLWHSLKISELIGAAGSVLPKLRHVDVEERTWIWGEIRLTHFETSYRDNRIWVGKHNLTTTSFHSFSRES